MDTAEIIFFILLGVPSIVGGILVIYGIISESFKSDYRWGIIAILVLIILVLVGRYLG